MKCFFSAVYLIVLLFAGNNATACDGHFHSNTYTWHTKAIKPELGNIAEGKVNTDSVYLQIIQFFISDKVPVQQVLEKAGLTEKEHIDLSELYKKKMGKTLPDNPTVENYILRLADIRNETPYAAQSAEKMYALANDIREKVADTGLSDALLATLWVYIESAHFWDFQLNFFPLSPKTESPVRRDTKDAEVFAKAFLQMKDLGLDNEEAHIIASIETAYQAALCKDCGVW